MQLEPLITFERGRQLMASLLSSHDWYVTYRPDSTSIESHKTEKRK